MYIVEGNIGVGKSTFLSLLKEKRPHIKILTEPLDNWNKLTYGQSLLSKFYNSPSRWAYTIETLTMISRVKDHQREQENSDPNRILERSIYSGHYCFALNDFQSGYLTDLEWRIYCQWVDFLVNTHCTPPHGFIYLKASPEICFERVQIRNRSSEKSLTINYMEKINKLHDRFLIEKKDIFTKLKDIPVLTLDCNEDFLTSKQKMQEHITAVDSFLQKTQSYKTSEQQSRYKIHAS